MTLLKIAAIASVPSATTVLAVVETVAPAATWTPELIGAFFLGLTTLLTTLLNVYLTHKAKAAVLAVKADVKEVHTVVQGGTLSLLKEVSSLKDQRAEGSDRASDQRAAEVARTAVTDKETLVADAARVKKEK